MRSDRWAQQRRRAAPGSDIVTRATGRSSVRGEGCAARSVPSEAAPSPSRVESAFRKIPE